MTLRVMIADDEELIRTGLRIVLEAEPDVRVVGEAEVLRLMARGLSNGEIAAELVLGLETVKTHVGNVLSKLGARDRTQAVIAAYESGFIPR